MSMKLSEYFEKPQGIDALATTNASGQVDQAIYSRPHFLNDFRSTRIMAPSPDAGSNQALEPFPSDQGFADMFRGWGEIQGAVGIPFEASPTLTPVVLCFGLYCLPTDDYDGSRTHQRRRTGRTTKVSTTTGRKSATRMKTKKTKRMRRERSSPWTVCT